MSLFLSSSYEILLYDGMLNTDTQIYFTLMYCRKRVAMYKLKALHAEFRMKPLQHTLYY